MSVQDTCQACATTLKLFELNADRYCIMQCEHCGLFYHYVKSGWHSDWKLKKVSKLIYKSKQAIEG